MKMYHATKRVLKIGDSLRTPTGRSEMNVLNGGVVYLTSDPESCQRYGTVYEIEVIDAVSYKAQLKKQGRTKKARYTKKCICCSARKHQNFKEVIMNFVAISAIAIIALMIFSVSADLKITPF